MIRRRRKARRYDTVAEGICPQCGLPESDEVRNTRKRHKGPLCKCKGEGGGLGRRNKQHCPKKGKLRRQRRSRFTISRRRLTTLGRSSRRRSAAEDAVPVANKIDSTDRSGYQSRLFLFTFGAYGWDKVLVWGRSMESALDEAVMWLEETDPRNSALVSDRELKELYNEAAAELGPDADEWEVGEAAAVDLTYANDRYIDSNWTVNDVYDEGVMEEAATNDYVRHV